MRFDRIIIMTAVLMLAFAASGCVLSPADGGLDSDQAKFQSASMGSEDVDADLDADVEARDAEKDADSSRAAEELQVNPIVTIDSDRFNRMAGISIASYQGLDMTAIVGESYWEQFTASAAGNPDMHFNWTVTGLPAGLTYSINGSFSQNLVVEGAPTVAGTFPIKVRAAQWADANNYKELPYDLVVSDVPPDNPDDPDDDVDPCSVPLKVEVIKHTTDKGGDWDPGMVQTAAPMNTGRTLTYRITGGKAPYKVKWESRVEDSFHCNFVHGSATKISYTEKEYKFVSPDNTGACNTSNFPPITEWTTNPTWTTVNTTVLLPIAGAQGEVERDTVSILGNTLQLHGTFTYDGPIPVDGLSKDKTPVESLSVSVTDSCPLKIKKFGEEKQGLGTISLRKNQAVRKFAIWYSDDNEEDLQASVEYGLIELWGDGDNDVRIELLSQKSDSNEYTLAEGELDVDELENCEGDTCGKQVDIKWTKDHMKVSDLVHARVVFGLSSRHDQDWSIEDACWKTHFHYGDMDVKKITIESPGWIFVYNDEVEGNDQMYKNNMRHDGGLFYITDISGVKFKRKAFPDTFVDKWEDACSLTLGNGDQDAIKDFLECAKDMAN